MSNVVKFPFNVSRRPHARKPRCSKNGSPEERAEAAAGAAATPAAVGALNFELSSITEPTPNEGRYEESPPVVVNGDTADAYLSTLFSRTYWTLPFVTMPAGECDVSSTFRR
jgi:hypothetical protein